MVLINIHLMQKKWKDLTMTTGLTSYQNKQIFRVTYKDLTDGVLLTWD